MLPCELGVADGLRPVTPERPCLRSSPPRPLLPLPPWGALAVLCWGVGALTAGWGCLCIPKRGPPKTGASPHCLAHPSGRRGTGSNLGSVSVFPLQVLKRQGYDAACDVWSLGILLYTMLAG